MTMTDDLLRETFAAEAETVSMRPDVRARVDAVVRRHRARRTAKVAVGTLAVAGLALAVPAVVPDLRTTEIQPPVASTSYESWAPRGTLGGDSGFAAVAAAEWDAASPGAPGHTDVNVLWADVFATGRAAVLVGTAGDGDRRLAVLAGAGPGLKVIRDIPAPQSITHLSFNLFTDDQEHSEGSYRDTVIVMTPPASGWTVEWTGETDPSEGSGESATTDGIAVIDISQSGPVGHPTIRVLDGGQERYAGPIGSQN